VVATGVLLVAAVVVRGVRGSEPELPEDRARAPEALAEPVQFLGVGAARRLAELTERVGPERREEWLLAQRAVFGIEGCPTLNDWLTTARGQRVQQVLADLRRGEPHEGLASLTLVMQIARATEWAPGVLGNENAQRMGALLQPWLRTWSEPAANDPLLAEPALAATLVYARVMRLAYEAPALTRDDAPYDRAKTFLDGLTGASEPQLTDFGQALATRYPDAFDGFRRKSDLLLGFDEECGVLFAELDGECGE
jgi:hypothetical protein